MSVKKSSPLLSTLWLASEKLCAMALVLLTTLILARHMGPDVFGQLNYLIAIVTLISPFAAMGLNAIVTRELVLKPEDNDKILASALGLRLAGAALASLLVFIATPWFVSAELRLAFSLLLVANICSAFLLFDYWLQAHVANSYAVKARLSVLLLLTVSRLLAVYFDAPLSFFILLAALEIALTGLAFLLVYILKGGGLTKLRFCAATAKSLLAQSWWLMLSGLAAIVYLKIDQVMLGQLSSHQQVGIYAVASRLSEVWYFFPVALVSSFFPKLLNSKKASPEQYQQQLQQLNDGLFAIAVTIAIVVMLIGEPVVVLLFGESYQASALVLSIHIWAGVFIFMRALLSKWLLAENLLRFSFVTQVAGALLNIVANYLLIPEYGAVGAAIATVLSYAVASYIALFLHPKTWPMAKMMSYSFLLPLRIVAKGRSLYQKSE
jgi:O-antigen/teichoic acid export membrane protein